MPLLARPAQRLVAIGTRIGRREPEPFGQPLRDRQVSVYTGRSQGAVVFGARVWTGIQPPKAFNVSYTCVGAYGPDTQVTSAKPWGPPEGAAVRPKVAVSHRATSRWPLAQASRSA